MLDARCRLLRLVTGFSFHLPPHQRPHIHLQNIRVDDAHVRLGARSARAGRGSAGRRTRRRPRGQPGWRSARSARQGRGRLRGRYHSASARPWRRCGHGGPGRRGILAQALFRVDAEGGELGEKWAGHQTPRPGWLSSAGAIFASPLPLPSLFCARLKVEATGSILTSPPVQPVGEEGVVGGRSEFMRLLEGGSRRQHLDFAAVQQVGEEGVVGDRFGHPALLVGHSGSRSLQLRFRMRSNSSLDQCMTSWRTPYRASACSW